MIYVFMTDLLFRAKIQETAQQLNKEITFLSTKADVDDFFDINRSFEAKPVGILIIDLKCDALTPLETIKKIKDNAVLKNKTAIAFGPHVEVNLLKEAHQLGAQVMPRSMFSKNLSQLLQ